jgi:hypothetical protein
MKKNLFALTALTVSLALAAQDLSDSDKKKLQIYLFDELTKQNFVKLNRVTKQGELSDCETEFQYVYRDIRARRGELVLLTGSFSSSWSPGKIPSYMFKINAGEYSIKESKWSITAPAFINVTVNKLSFKPYKSIDFICESGGRCVGFTDPKFRINTSVVEAYPFDAILTWSLNEGGMDNSVKLSEIGNKPNTRQALESFYSCNLEIIKKLSDYLKSDSK